MSNEIRSWKDGSIYGEIDFDLLTYIKELIKDIKTLIKYYTTDNETEKENLENAVQEIIKYYEGKKLGR